jgi:hypothetical protein
MRKNICAFLLVVAIIAGSLSTAWGRSDFLERFNDTYGTRGTALETCTTCHSTVPDLNPYGEDYRDNGFDFDAIEQKDSDGDGFSNIDEINARSLPGDSENVPSSEDQDSGCFIATAASGTLIGPSITLGLGATVALVLLFSTGLIVSLSILLPRVINSITYLFLKKKRVPSHVKLLTIPRELC